MDNLAAEIGQRIHDSRQKKGLKQKDFLVLLDGATTQMLSKWEKGHSIPSAFYLIKIAKILDISLDYLLTGKEIRSDNNDNITYKKIIESINTLKQSGLFRYSNATLGTLNSFEIITNDKIICNCCQNEEILDKAADLLGKETYDIQILKLINELDYPIKTPNKK